MGSMRGATPMGAMAMPSAGPARERAANEKGSTAFYALAEHLRLLSGGRINHKMLYSLLGTNGYYVNHKNPSIRKRTAASLSRLVHSSRYAADFQHRYADDPLVFTYAAETIVGTLLEMGHDTGELARAFCDVMWPDIARGLALEHARGRTELNPRRVSNEMSALFRAFDMVENDAAGDKVTRLMEAFLQVITFGYLEPSLAHNLFDETPLASDVPGEVSVSPRRGCACLVRCSSLTSPMLGDLWLIDASEPFVIGRYADCGAIETDPAVSRRHCRIACVDGVWQLEDLGSRNGTRLYRGGDVIFDSATARTPQVALRHDDTVVLAGRERYWFGLFGGDEPAPAAPMPAPRGAR